MKVDQVENNDTGSNFGSVNNDVGSESNASVNMENNRRKSMLFLLYLLQLHTFDTLILLISEILVNLGVTKLISTDHQDAGHGVKPYLVDPSNLSFIKRLESCSKNKNTGNIKTKKE